jgi:hypothetical protein
MTMNSLKLSLLATGILVAICTAGYAQEPARPSPPLPEQGTQKAEPGRITVDELKAKLAKGEPVFIIDSRSEGSYSSSDKQIKGAVRIPPSDVELHLKDIPKDKELIVYCS